VAKVETAVDEHDVRGISVGGGVAANQRLRTKLNQLVDERDLELFIPPISLCTDNGAMIAGKAHHLARTKSPDRLDMDAVPT
jgi:N6-L-threonylcarbamoyladenine synthase